MQNYPVDKELMQQPDQGLFLLFFYFSAYEEASWANRWAPI